jgi:amino acid transporter
VTPSSKPILPANNASPVSPGLRRALGAREYFTLAFGTMIGVGWMVVIDDWLTRGGAIGAIAGFLIGGFALIPIGYVYGRLTERMPDAGSEIAYTSTVFPEQVSFATGWMMTLAYLIVCPYEAVAIGRICSYLVPQMNSIELYRIGDYPVFLPHLAAGLLLTAVIVLVNYRGVEISAKFQNATTFGLLGIFAVFTTLGLFKGDAANWQPPFAHGGVLGALSSTLLVLQIVPYFMTGFEAVPKCSEEAAANFKPRDFTRVIFFALGAGIFFYVTIIAVVTLIQPWPSLTKERFATAVAFERAFGSRALVQLIMYAVLLSLLQIFNGNFITATRLLFAMGRRNLLDSRLALVDKRFATPKVAIAFAGAITALASFAGQAVLVPISEVGSLAAAIGWLATCLAFLRGAGKIADSPRLRLVGYSGAIVAVLLIAMKVVPSVPGSFGRYEYVALGAWIAVGFVLWKRRALS